MIMTLLRERKVMTSGRFYYLGVVCAVEGSRTKHEVDGRVILAEFHSFRLLNTYVPNNGWKDEDMGFPRRRAWDQRMLEFVTRPSNKPLVWCGDLNVRYTFPTLIVCMDQSILVPYIFQRRSR